MGNIIKINMYADIKKNKDTKLDLQTIEKEIIEYNKWIKKSNNEDKIETYKKFLKA